MTFIGKFELLTSENFDEYLKACGVGVAKRALAATAKPTIEITQDGDKYSMKTISAFKNTEISFKLGEEFDEETADGRKAKSTMIAEGNKLIHSQKVGDAESKTVREFNGGEMKATFTAKGVTAIRVYKKVA